MTSPRRFTVINGIGWDVTLTTLGASWASEATMYFDDNVNPDGFGLFLSPGAGDNFGVTDQQYTSGDTNGDGVPDIIKLGKAGIDDILLPDGVLRLEFFESFDDVGDSIDASWVLGTLYVQVLPGPGVLALVGIAGICAPRRRRRD